MGAVRNQLTSQNRIDTPASWNRNLTLPLAESLVHLSRDGNKEHSTPELGLSKSPANMVLSQISQTGNPPSNLMADTTPVPPHRGDHPSRNIIRPIGHDTAATDRAAATWSPDGRCPEPGAGATRWPNPPGPGDRTTSRAMLYIADSGRRASNPTSSRHPGNRHTPFARIGRLLTDPRSAGIRARSVHGNATRNRRTSDNYSPVIGGVGNLRDGTGRARSGSSHRITHSD
jgi:hypothetical protein